ncbi:jg12281 [Pararge aegeria aegeria]|uniref:Jg12281 protein n=1 Tax=Pararge aegeria aegeria TaxID=348720 RepID=A0A8S4RRW1_9NEOP|nr:jg12281 [Pararge aegeria aegeria]
MSMGMTIAVSLQPFKCHKSLYVHRQNVHKNKEQKEKLCHVCGKSYRNAAKLKYHIVAMHTRETPYRCAQCGAAFGWYSSLYRHVREVHYKVRRPGYAPPKWRRKKN